MLKKLSTTLEEMIKHVKSQATNNQKLVAIPGPSKIND